MWLDGQRKGTEPQWKEDVQATWSCNNGNKFSESHKLQSGHDLFGLGFGPNRRAGGASQDLLDIGIPDCPSSRHLPFFSYPSPSLLRMHIFAGGPPEWRAEGRETHPRSICFLWTTLGKIYGEWGGGISVLKDGDIHFRLH